MFLRLQLPPPLATKPLVQARCTSQAAPEMSGKISSNLGWELGRHGLPGNNARLPAAISPRGAAYAQKMQQCFCKRLRPSVGSFWGSLVQRVNGRLVGWACCHRKLFYSLIIPTPQTVSRSHLFSPELHTSCREIKNNAKQSTHSKPAMTGTMQPSNAPSNASDHQGLEI